MGEGGEIPMRLPMNDGAIETVEYMWVGIWCMLDWIIRLRHKTAEIHFPCVTCLTSRLVSTQNETLLWLMGLKCAKI